MGLAILLFYDSYRAFQDNYGKSGKTPVENIVLVEPVVRPARFDYKHNHRGEGNAFDVDYTTDIHKLYKMTGSLGDTKLANRSVWRGTQPKRAIDIRARADKHNFAKWFADGELEQQEKRVWWEDTDDIWGSNMGFHH
jgi:hypothetical protein